MIMIKSGTAFFIARTAFATAELSENDSEPFASFFSGRPNKRTAGIPREATSLASLAIVSGEQWKQFVIDSIGFFIFEPGHVNSG